MSNNPPKYEVLLKQCLRSINKCEEMASFSELMYFLSGFIYIFIPLHWRREGKYQAGLVLTVSCLSCQRSIRRQSVSSGSQSFIQSVSQPVSQSVSQPVNQSVSQLVSQSISQSVSQSASQSISQSASQSISQSVSQPVNQSVSQPASQSVSQPVSQSVS